jgi:hypothetical protein
MKALDERFAAEPETAATGTPGLPVLSPLAWCPRLVAAGDTDWFWMTACGPLLLPRPPSGSLPALPPATPPESGASLETPATPLPQDDDAASATPRSRLDGDSLLPSPRFPRLPR